MSTEPQRQARPIGAVQPRATDPFAGLDSDQIWRCEDRVTGWLWFYARGDEGVAKFHERDGFEARPTARTIVAETVALDRVRSCVVSKAHLDVRTGEL